MSKIDPRPPQDALEENMKELLIEVEKEAVPPRLRELAHRLDAALGAARLRRDE